MRAVDIIRKKRDGGALDPAEIEAFVHGATTHAWPDYQVSALLMAIVWRGMDAHETAELTAAMIRSGEKLDLSDLPGAKVDKHSTGGVGDKTSLILAPLAAACGVVVPMMSGRGLGHTGGTLDKLESIPGFRVHLGLDEFRATLGKIGCAMIGQTAQIAPADKVLYGLRDVTATVESIPLISASIMSKKVAEGIDGLVLDVKCGRGAFMPDQASAWELASAMVAIGTAHGVRTEAVLTRMDEPLGHMVGNALEVIESVETLKGNGPADLEGLSVHLAARMVRLAGRAANLDEAERQVRQALASGRGLEKFRELVAAQGGDPRVVDDYTILPAAPKRHLVRAAKAGFVGTIHSDRLGRAAMLLGAGRGRADEGVDPRAGMVVLAPQGTRVAAGDPILELHYADDGRLSAALSLAERAMELAVARPSTESLLLESIESDR